MTPRWPPPEALDRIARAYTGRLWHAGKGFGTEQTPASVRPHVPRFADRYIAAKPDSDVAKSLQEKVEWCRQQPGSPTGRGRNLLGGSPEEQLKRGRELLTLAARGRLIPLRP